MTPTPDEICERLRNGGHCREAADLIQQQQATIERLSAALERARDYLRDEGRHTAMDQIRTLDMIDAALGKDVKE